LLNDFFQIRHNVIYQLDTAQRYSIFFILHFFYSAFFFKSFEAFGLGVQGFCVSRLEGRSVRSTERSEARKVATRSEAKGHALIKRLLAKYL
jgi:hypothetical protein